MRMSVTAVTKDSGIVNMDEMLVLAGKQAGICYMADDYKALDLDEAGARKRIQGCMKSGHHSTIEHCYVTVLFENVSKIFAMLLNGLQAYNTSEKSGRFTLMQSEEGLYGKWLKIYTAAYTEDLKKRGIAEDKIEALAKKFAQDSARGVISITAPNTTMAYTTSIRMWNYIRSWAIKYRDVVVKNEALATIKATLDKELATLVDFIDETMRVSYLDSSGEFDFITNFSDYTRDYVKLGTDYRKWGVNYLITYKASFIETAQAERHRTIRYYMAIPESDYTYNIPNIIKNTDYAKEWVEDLKTVFMPQALEITLIEQGNVETFINKAYERICGAANECIREHTVQFLKDYFAYANTDDVEAKFVKSRLQSILDTDNNIVKPKVKCSKGYTCVRPCIYKHDVENL